MASNTTVKKEVTKKVKIFAADGSKAEGGVAGVGKRDWQFKFGEVIDAPQELIDVLNDAGYEFSERQPDGGVKKVFQPRFIVQTV